MTDQAQGAGGLLAPDVSDPVQSSVGGGPDRTHRSTGRQRILVAVAAGIPGLTYLLYVFHYAVNVPYEDDWDGIGFVVTAFRGHLTLSDMWAQYVAGRPFVSRLFLLAFGKFDHLNEKSITLLSAALFIASFVILLLLFRSYWGRRLTFLSVLSIGVVWFSLADVENALWASQLAVYVVLLCFTSMMYWLLVPGDRRNLFLALGLVAAIAASLSYLQGFLLWPMGLICLLWISPWCRRTYYESMIWVLAAAMTSAIYLHGYNSAGSTCLVEGGQSSGACSAMFALQHPVLLIRYLVVLVGNVVSTSFYALEPRYVLAYEILGTAICVVAGLVVVQSIHERRTRSNPLPLLLIVFALLFDLIIAQGHLGEGLQSAGIDRFTMPNIILLVGILVYGWGHEPNMRRLWGGIIGR